MSKRGACAPKLHGSVPSTAAHQTQRHRQRQQDDRVHEKIHASKPLKTSGAVSHGSTVLLGHGRKVSANLGEEIEPAPSQRSVLAGGLLEETAV